MPEQNLPLQPLRINSQQSGVIRYSQQSGVMRNSQQSGVISVTALFKPGLVPALTARQAEREM